MIQAVEDSRRQGSHRILRQHQSSQACEVIKEASRQCCDCIGAKIQRFQGVEASECTRLDLYDAFVRNAQVWLRRTPGSIIQHVVRDIVALLSAAQSSALQNQCT